MSQTIGGALLVALVLLAAGRTGPGLLLLGAVVALMVLVAKGKAVVGRPATGRVVMGHGHGTQKMIAKHEAGHAAAARALGGSVRSMEIWKDGGYTKATLPNSDPQAAITFWRAGRYAAGTGAGCSGDDSLVRRELRTVPKEDRARVRRDADRDARRIVSRQAGRIRRDAQQLLRESES